MNYLGLISEYIKTKFRQYLPLCDGSLTTLSTGCHSIDILLSMLYRISLQWSIIKQVFQEYQTSFSCIDIAYGLKWLLFKLGSISTWGGT